MHLNLLKSKQANSSVHLWVVIFPGEVVQDENRLGYGIKNTKLGLRVSRKDGHKKCHRRGCSEKQLRPSVFVRHRHAHTQRFSRKTHGFRSFSHLAPTSETNSSSSNWILMSCQPHRITSGQSNSGHKQIHISKLFSHIYQPSVKSI